jgi:hypothetical protein
VAEAVERAQHAIAVAILNANALSDDTTIYETLTFPQVARFANVRGYLADARDAAAVAKKETDDLKAERDRALAEVGRLEATLELARQEAQTWHQHYIGLMNRWVASQQPDAALQPRGEGEP